MNNIFEEFLEKKNFEQWLVEKKKETRKNKVDIDDFVDQYGEEDGKSMYYRAMKRKSKGKKKINEALLTALVGGAVAAGVGISMYNRYNRVNKDLNARLDAHQARTGKPAGEVAREGMKQASYDAIGQNDVQKAHDLFQPEKRFQSRLANGRIGPMVTTQTRGTLRQSIKDRVSSALDRHPIIRGMAMSVGTRAADAIHDRFTAPYRP
jgi:hypothetical protein